MRDVVLGLNFVRRHPPLSGLVLAGVAAGYLVDSRLDPVAWDASSIPELSSPLAARIERLDGARGRWAASESHSGD